MNNTTPYLNNQARESKDQTFNVLYPGNEQVGQSVYHGQIPGQPLPGQYPPAYYQQPMVIVVQNNTNQLKCPFCNRMTNSIVQYRNGCLVWLLALVLCLLTGCCCFIPFLVQQWKDKEILCQSCGRVKAQQPGRMF